MVQEVAMASVRAAIGERLKELRFRRNLTLAEVSQLTGVSVSALSKIENLQVSPSFDVIMRISEGMDISLEDLVHSDRRKAEVTGRKTLTPKGSAVALQTGQYEYKVHATELAHKHMVPLEMEIYARSPDEFERWGSHPGEEFLYVLEGEVVVHTELYKPFRLKAGESAYFDSSMSHIYVSVSPSNARVLSVSYDPNLGRRPWDSLVAATQAAETEAT